MLALVNEISEWKEFKPDGKQRLEAVIETNRKVIEPMVEGSRRSCFRYSSFDQPALERAVPNLSILVQANRLLIVDALLKAEKNRVDEAIDQILKGLQFARLWAESPELISFLASMPNTRMLVHNLNRIVYRRELPVATATIIIELLDPE